MGTGMKHECFLAPLLFDFVRDKIFNITWNFHGYLNNLYYVYNIYNLEHRLSNVVRTSQGIILAAILKGLKTYRSQT